MPFRPSAQHPPRSQGRRPTVAGPEPRHPADRSPRPRTNCRPRNAAAPPRSASQAPSPHPRREQRQRQPAAKLRRRSPQHAGKSAYARPNYKARQPRRSRDPLHCLPHSRAVDCRDGYLHYPAGFWQRGPGFPIGQGSHQCRRRGDHRRQPALAASLHGRMALGPGPRRDADSATLVPGTGLGKNRAQCQTFWTWNWNEPSAYDANTGRSAALSQRETAMGAVRLIGQDQDLWTVCHAVRGRDGRWPAAGPPFWRMPAVKPCPAYSWRRPALPGRAPR